MTCNGHTISKGESAYWANLDNLIPIGYRYDRARNSPELLTIEVRPTLEVVSWEPEQLVTQEVVNMKAWAKEEREYYRMAM